MPAELRPGYDITCSPDDFHILAFLSIEYHGTMIALHRAPLIAPKQKIEDEVAKHIPDNPSRFRLSSGESICVNSARAVAKSSLELQDRGLDTVLIPTGTAGLACIALTIYLMKHPDERMQAADMQLLKACLEYSSSRFAQSAFDKRYLEGLDVIFQQIRTRLGGYSAQHRSSGKTVPRGIASYQPSSSSSLPGNKRAPPAAPSFEPLHTPSSSEPYATLDGHTKNHHGTNWAQQDLSGQTFERITHDNSIGSRNTHAVPSDPLQDIPLDTSARSDPLFNKFPDTIPELPTGIDELYPFEGFNVEDLWNWILYLDSPGATTELL